MKKFHKSGKDPISLGMFKRHSKVQTSQEMLVLYEMYKTHLQSAFESLVFNKGYKDVTSYFYVDSVKLDWSQTFSFASDPLKNDTSKGYTLSFTLVCNCLLIRLLYSKSLGVGFKSNNCITTVHNALFNFPEESQVIKGTIVPWLENIPEFEKYSQLRRK